MSHFTKRVSCLCFCNASSIFLYLRAPRPLCFLPDHDPQLPHSTNPLLPFDLCGVKWATRCLTRKWSDGLTYGYPNMTWPAKELSISTKWIMIGVKRSSVCPSVRPLFICFSVTMSVRSSVCLYVRLFVCASVWLFICLSLCPSASLFSAQMWVYVKEP